jgi:hypothetical protein
MAATTSVDLPPALLRATEDRRCILFVGSGLSVAAGYPSWAMLVDRLVSEARAVPHARANGIDEYLAQKDYLTLAEFARSTLGVSRYGAILREELGKPVTPSPAHEVVARTDYRGVITTNYDKLLETAITLTRHWSPTALTPESISGLATALFDKEFFVFKLHGEIGSIETVVLTTQDYDRLIMRSPHVRVFLQAVFLNYTLLFVGYSVRDPDFQLLLRELNVIFQGYTPTHFALLPAASEFTSEYMRRLNIQAIPYDPRDGHGEVVDFLEKVQRVAPFSS